MDVDFRHGTSAHFWSRATTNGTTCDAHLGWNAPQPRFEDTWNRCNREIRNLVIGKLMVDANEDLRLTMSTLVVVLEPHVWCFGRRIDIDVSFRPLLLTFDKTVPFVCSEKVK